MDTKRFCSLAIVMNFLRTAELTYAVNGVPFSGSNPRRHLKVTHIPMRVSSSAEYVFRDRPKLLISAAVRPVQSRITFSCALRSPCRAAKIIESGMLTGLKENSFLIKLIFKFIYLCCCGPLLGCAVGESTKNYAKIPDLSSLSGQLGKNKNIHEFGCGLV